MVFEPSVLFPTAAVWVEIDDMVQNFPWSKLELYCKAPVSSSIGRTENIPLLNKRLDELIECNFWLNFGVKMKLVLKISF